MFGKKYLKRELEEEKEDNIINEIENVIRPIVFVGEEEFDTPGLLELPSQITTEYNILIARNGSLIWDLDNSSIDNLKFNSLQIAVDQTVYSIIQNTFFNFCSVIDSMNYSVLEYFPIKQFVYSAMNKVSPNIRTMVFQFIGGNNAPTAYKNNEKDINNCKTFEHHIAGQITNYLFGIICFAVDDAINDILLQVHLVPNIDRIYSLLYDDSEFLQKNWKNKKKFDSNYGELAAIFLKNIIREALYNILLHMMLDCIDNILFSSVSTLYYVFGDMVKFKELKYKNKDNKNDKE